MRLWLGCGNSIPRYVFPILKTSWAPLGAPKTSRDTKKHCGKPGCPNNHRSQVLSCGDEVNKGVTTAFATFRTSINVRLESAFRGKGGSRIWGGQVCV